MPRRQVIEIYAPTAGFKSNSPTILMDPRTQPYGLNAKLYYGANQKEYGTSLYATATGAVLGAPINFMFEAKFPNSNTLQIFTHTGVHRYSSGSDLFVVDGQTFNGTYTDYWDGIMYNDQFFYLNGVDPIQYKASFSATGTNMNSAVNTSTYTAWSINALADHLCIYHVYENGTEFFKRVQWTKKGALSPSGTDDFIAGTAGAQDLQDAQGEIKTAKPLGDGIAIYAERSIHIQTFVGGDAVYNFDRAVNGVGTPSRRGVVSYKDVNYFVSHDNFHAYFGGDDVRDIGDQIKAFAFGEINDSAMANAYVEADPEQEEILFHVPTGTSDLPNRTWVYRIDDDSWIPLARNYTANGRFTRVSGLTIGELQGNIGAQNFRYGDAFVKVESLTRLYGDQSGRVVKVDPSVYTLSESGTNASQQFVYDTPDLTGGNYVDPETGNKVDFTSTNKRWTQVNIEMAGQGMASVFFSTDKGSIYTELPESPVTLVNTGTNHIIDIDVTSKYIRYEVVNTGTNEWVAIRYIGAEFIPGSEN